MEYIKFHVELRDDYLKEHLSNIKKLRDLVTNTICNPTDNILLSLDEVINFFDDALLKHEENNNHIDTIKKERCV